MKTQIKPIARIMDTIEIKNVSIVVKEGGNTAQVSALLTGEISEMEFIDLTPEEYALWGDDDNYILNLVITKLGLERA